MRKLKQIVMACALLLATGQAWAQTDVTSTYITNADFEGSYSVFTNPSSDRAIFQPEGWTVTRTGSDKNDMSILKSTDLGNNSFTSFTINDATSRGDQTYWTRLRWGNNTGLKLSQTKTLQPGSYTLSALVLNYNQNTTNNKAEIFAGSKSATASNSNTKGDGAGWKTLTVNFTIDEASEIEIGFRLTHKTESNGEQIVGVDNFSLFYTDLKAELRTVIAQAQAINNRIETLDTDITTAQGVLNEVSSSKTAIDDAVTALRSAISTKLAAYTGLNAEGDDITSFIVNNGFETSPIFDGTSLGSNSNPKSNATPTVGSTLLFNSANVYQINGWELMTTETSDFARTLTLPYNTTLYVQGNNTVAGQAISSPTNGSSVTENNANLLFVEANWCENAILGVKQTIPLLKGSYRMTFDSYVTTTTANASSLCGVSYGDNTDYQWPTATNTWTSNEVDFTLDEQTDVTISMGYKKIGNKGGGESAFLFIDNIKLTYFDPLKLAQLQWQSVHDALAALDATLLPDAAEAAITEELAKNVLTNVDDVNAAKDALQALIDSYDGIKAAYDKVNALITLATNEMTNSNGTKDGIGAAISTATANIETRTSADDLATDYTTLEEARQTYVTSGAIPTDGNAFDWTFKLDNPDFENGTTGWTNERNTTGQYNYGTTETAMQHGTKGLDVWAPQINYINVFQNKNLPAGVYELSAYVYSSNPYQQHVYANNGENYPSAYLNEKGSWEKLSTTFINFAERSTKLGIYSQGKNENNNTDGWFRIDNFQLLFKGVTVDDATATALLESVPEEGIMQGSVQTTLNDTKTTFESDKTIANYNELKDAIGAAKTSIDSYTAANTKLTAMKEVVDATNVYTKEALDVYYTIPKEKYEKRTLTNEEAAALQNPSTKTEWHEAITVDDFLLSAWNTAPDFDKENSPYYINTWSTEGNNDGSGMTTPFFEYYVDYTAEAKLAERTLTATITDVTPGNYYVDMLVRISKNAGEDTTVSGITMDVNNGETTDLCTGAKDVNGRFYGTFRAFGTVEEDGVLKININVAEDNNVHWLAFKNVKYEVFNGATEEQKEALATAIKKAEGKTMGFANGEYAPYKNIEVMEALADAKVLNPETATGAEVTAATTAIGDANWTANDGDVDAIYNGLYATVAEGKNYPDGWTRTNAWGQMKSGLEGDYATAYYNQPGSLKYGDTGLYTMPLAANTMYKLTFAYRSHENNSNNGVTVSVLNGEDGLAATTFAKNGSTTEWKTATQYFTTGAAGNYVLTLANSGNTWMTGVSLTKAVIENITIDETKEFIPTDDYANVTLTRTIKAGVNTLVLPFDMTQAEVVETFGKDSKVYEVQKFENDNISFVTADGITANKPCLLKATEAGSEYTIDERITKTGTPVANGTGVSMIGTYTNMNAPEGSYIISGDKIYQVNSTVVLKSTRAYITISQAGARVLSMSFDDGTSGIATLTNGELKVETGDLYDLSGRKVNNPTKKGLYIINGKKVVK